MWIDRHPYLFVYLLGSALVLLLGVCSATLFWVLAWITKANVVANNLKKLNPPDEESRAMKAAAFTAALVFETALSWIGVIVAVWQIIATLLKLLREGLVSTPEEIKLLRFPLRNNPNMSREAVWAHVQALKIKVGEAIPSRDSLLVALENVREDYPTFDAESALSQLQHLNVVRAEVVSSVLSAMSFDNEEE